MNKSRMMNAAALFAALMVGCGERAPAPADVSEAKPQAAPLAVSLPEGLLAKESPGNAVGVVEARKQVAPGAKIVVTGYVGGREDPLVEGRAIFTLADAQAMTRCDAEPGEGCKTPWDACCVSPEIKKASIASVQVVDGDGMVLKHTLAGFGGIKPGSTVTVRGKVAPGSSDSALVVNAERIHVAQ